LKINPVNLHGDRKVFGVGDKGEISSRQICKLKPWLSQAQKNITHSTKILSELDKIKVIDVQKETLEVNRATLVTKAKIEEFEEMLRPKAWFINKLPTQVSKQMDPSPPREATKVLTLQPKGINEVNKERTRHASHDPPSRWHTKNHNAQ